MNKGISTHVLDTALGKPAEGVAIVLEARDSTGWKVLAHGVTDGEGRVAALLPGGPPSTNDYRIRFATGVYFASLGQSVFYPEVVIHVHLEAHAKYHLPLLLSPFGYSTYRGS
ncbi:hydroxyisourate hydrolase [soil metagenome]